MSKTSRRKHEPEMPLNLPYEPGKSNRELLRWAWQVCGYRKGRYPASLRDCLNLAKLCGFDGTRELFRDAIGCGEFDPPTEGRWNENDVVRYLDYLEQKRDFLPCHQFHIHKLTSDELEQANRQRATIEGFLHYCESLELPDLIRLVIDSEHERNRELIGAVLSAKCGLLQPKPNRN